MLEHALDIKSGYPWWAVSNGLLHSFPPLLQDARCDVVVVGGGITGVLMARELARHGHDVLLLERREYGWGSTAASTALLQYEIDVPLRELAHKRGAEAAAMAYRSCAQALEVIKAVCAEVGDCGYASARSLYLASCPDHVRRLQREVAARRRIGLEGCWLEAAALQGEFGIDAPGAILTPLAAQVDAYRFTRRLAWQLLRLGVRVHDAADMDDIQTGARGVCMTTRQGAVVRARHAVLCLGYETQRWCPQRVARNRSSYALVTDPVADLPTAWRRLLIWESARPYLYIRDTRDGRLIVGGEDDAVDVPARRDRRLARKERRLRDKLQALLPVPLPETAFCWAGTFAETRDGLPFFGPHAGSGPRIHFAMAYGGNGIVYSMLGAELVRARVERRAHPLQRLFGFERLNS